MCMFVQLLGSFPITTAAIRFFLRYGSPLFQRLPSSSAEKPPKESRTTTPHDRTDTETADRQHSSLGSFAVGSLAKRSGLFSFLLLIIYVLLEKYGTAPLAVSLSNVRTNRGSIACIYFFIVCTTCTHCPSSSPSLAFLVINSITH